MTGFLVMLDLLTGKHEKPETGLNSFLTFDEATSWLLGYLDTHGENVVRVSIYDKTDNTMVYYIENTKYAKENKIRKIIETKSGATFYLF